MNTWKSKMFLKELLFTPDGNTLLAISQTDSITSIDIRTGKIKLMKSITSAFNTLDVCLSPDGQILAFMENGLITLWSMDRNAIISKNKIEKPVRHLSFSPDSKMLYFGARNELYGRLIIDINKLEIAYLKTPKATEVIRFSEDQHYALAFNADYSVDWWDIHSQRFQKTIFQPSFAWAAFDISPRGDYAVMAGTLDKRARIFSLKDGQMIILPEMKDDIKVVRLSPSGKYILTNSMADGTIHIWNTANGQEVQVLKGVNENSDIQYSSKQFIVLRSKSSVKVWDLRQNVLTNYALDSTILCTAINNERKIYGIKRTGERSGNQYVLVNLISGNELCRFQITTGFKLDQDAKCLISPNEALLLITKTNGTLQPTQWIDIKSGTVKKEIKLKFISPNRSLAEQFLFLHDNTHIVMQGHKMAKQKSIVFNYNQEPVTEYDIDDYRECAVSASDHLYFSSAQGIFQVNLLTGKKIKYSELRYSTKNQSLWSFFNTKVAYGEFSKIFVSGFENLQLADMAQDQVDFIPLAHLAPINYVNFIAHDSILVSSSVDGQIKFWDVQSRKELLELRNPNGIDWVAKSPDGLFDASSNEFRELYFVKDMEVVELDQMKARFYEPHLLQKKLGFSNEVLRKSSGLGQLSIYPSIRLENPGRDASVLRIILTDEGGGIGKVVIKINNKEAVSDGRKYLVRSTDSTAVIDFLISNHPFLLPNTMNTIDVVAYNQEEYLQSRAKRYHYFFDSKNEVPNTLRFYGLFVGISDYSGNDIDLKYASNDAASLSQAIKWSAEKQFGIENVSITTLISNGGAALQPSKENIKFFFEVTAAKARPQDVLMIFMAGHGLNFGGNEGDFYFFLTAEASSGDIRDPMVRSSTAISSQELTDYIKMVPSLKQVLILDACHAGQYATDLLASARSEKPASEIRALEHIKDRTGLYVLSGSAADAVSYEASAYGQGILTYSLLFGVKGAALRDGKYVDIMNLFQFATDEVPRLAESVGGIQKPEIRIPYGAKSFDIGIMDESVQSKIILPSPRPLFSKSNYSDDNTFNDDLRLSEKLDELFMTMQSRVLA